MIRSILSSATTIPSNRAAAVDGFSNDDHSAAARFTSGKQSQGRLLMRASIIALGLAAGLAAVPAHADPAYKASSIVDFFSKASLGKSRALCFNTSNCPAPAPTPKWNLMVNFEFDSDRLTAAAKENLDQFAEALHDPRLKDLKFDIDGHTDATGAEQYNLGLSERRAQAVVAYLGTKGVDENELRAKGFGKNKPVVPDPFSPENRRVEAHILEQP
jgi:outer membrane protein OmpA-like peptidoglycan-associated protein